MTELNTISDQASPIASISGVARSDIGRRREENQDSFGIIENSFFKMFVVADGMGGVKGGAVASSTAVSVIKEELENAQGLDEEKLSLAIHAANQKILEEAHRQPALTGMGTTCVGLAFVGTDLYVTNVGDSRAYRIRSGAIQQLTEDHTLVMELLRSGTISPDQAQNHPVSHMLTRSLGPAQDLEVDCWRTVEPPRKNDIFLLCSDGLYNLVKDAEMAQIVSTSPLEEAANELIALANQRGGTDNITVILVRVGEEFPVDMESPEAAAEREQQGISNGAALGTRDLEAELGEQDATEIANNNTDSGSISDGSTAQEGAGLSKITRTVGPKRYGLLMLGVIIGSAGMLIIGKMLQSPPAPYVERVPNQIGIPDISLESGDDSGGSNSGDSEGQNVGDLKHDSIAAMNSQNPEKLALRREDLKVRIKNLEEKINSFERPLAGNLPGILRDSESRISDLQKQLEKIRGEVDVATRKLAIWYQRRKRLKEGDPVNLANEIAVSSDKVREKKDEFERVTWSYLREAEVLVYDPTNSKQSEKVNDLRKDRKQKKTELIDEIRAAIERAASESDQEIIDLIAKRDKTTIELNDTRLNADYARALMGNDEQAKANLREELSREKETLQEELESVEQGIKSLGTFPR